MKYLFKIFIMLVCMLSLIAFFITKNLVKNIDKEIFINPSVNIKKLDRKLYFVDDQSNLKYEERSIIINKKSVEEELINSLIKGAKNSNYKTIFDYNFSLNSINVIKNVCYIDIGINKNGYALFNDEDLKLYIWSIVNTLTEQNNILNVQFLFDGKKQNKQLMENYNLRDPLPRLETLVYDDKTYPSDVLVQFLKYLSINRYDLAYSFLSDESKSDISYQEFISFSKKINEELNQYELDFYFTQRFSSHWIILFKYKIKNNKTKYISWKIIKEEGIYKIDFLHKLHKKNTTE